MSCKYRGGVVLLGLLVVCAEGGWFCYFVLVLSYLFWELCEMRLKDVLFSVFLCVSGGCH